MNDTNNAHGEREFRDWLARESRPRTLDQMKPHTAIIGRNTNPAHDAFDAHLRGLAGQGSYTQDAYTGRQLNDTPPTQAPAPAQPQNAAEAAALAAGLPADAGPLLVGTTPAELADSAQQLAQWQARQRNR